MFDPLDFISAGDSFTVLQDNQKLVEASVDAQQCLWEKGSEMVNEEIDNDAPIQTIDLPYVQMAPSSVILTVLLLLQPSAEVNFSHEKRSLNQSIEKTCQEKQISLENLDQAVGWYKRMANTNLDTKEKNMLENPQLASCQDGKELLGYYTRILSTYNKMDSTDPVVEKILKEVSLRISEKCGRTAQPSMTRTFKMEKLNHSIKLHEPSLTADNLGLKTWGASLILSQKICENFAAINSTNKLTRILELGAGTGLVGITFARKIIENEDLCRYTIYLTDLPEIVPNLERNVELNELREQQLIEIRTDVLDWTNPSSFIAKHGTEKFDTILIADPIYSPEHPVWIVNMIAEFLSEEGIVYLELPVRAKYAEERQMLWNLLEERGLVTVEEQYDDGVDDWGNVKYIYKKITWNHN